MEPLTTAPVNAGHVVMKPLTSSPPSLGGHMTSQLFREGHVMRNIVRTMVINMETVLGDLRGIMGEIQSLVTDIDSVTDKIDLKCQEGDRLKPAEHVVKKPQCVHLTRTSSSSDLSTNSSSKSMIIHSLGTEKKDEYAKVIKRHRGPKANQAHVTEIPRKCNMNVPMAKTTSKDMCEKDVHVHGIPSCLPKATKLPLQGHKVPKHTSNVPSDTTKHAETTQPYTTSQATKSYKKSQHTDATVKEWSGRSNSFKVHPRHGAGSHVKHRNQESRKSWPNDIPLPFNLLRKKEQKVMSPSDEYTLRVALPALKNSAQRDRHHRESKKRHTSKSKNVAVSDSTHHVLKPDIQSPQISPQKSPDNAIFHDRIYEEIPTLPKPKRSSSVVVNKAFQPKTPTEQISPITHIGMTQNVHVVKKPNVDSSSLEDFSLSYRPKANRVPASLRRSGASSHSPKLKRPTVEPEFDPDSKWMPVGKLPVSPTKQTANQLYQSLESDLDSEPATSEINDIRSITPDMDWSYLGLIGNQNQRFVTDDGYEIPVIPESSEPSSHRKEKTSKRDSRDVGRDCATSESASTSQNQQTPTFHASIESLVDKICKSPIVNHVFCNEVTNLGKDGYCGCYEAVVDAVLENIAGFESTESATCEFDDTVSETYISFDVDFEDDDWNIGLRHRDEDGFSSNEICFPNFSLDEFYEDDLFLNYDSTIDRNRETRQREDKGNEGNAIASNALNKGFEKSCKRKLSPLSPDYTKHVAGLRLEDVRITGFQRCSFEDENICGVKQISSPDQANVWPQFGAVVTSSDDQSTEMSSSFSSDEVSIPQHDSDCSNMSLSSPELVACSPDTDVFVTSSDADDVFRSREESPAKFSNHRQKMMKLRRDFFDSVFNTSDFVEDKPSTFSTVSEMGSVKQTEDSISLDNALDNVSETGSYSEDRSNYNRNVNTWTAYALVHLQPDDISDTASDILNDNSINNCSLTGSYLDVDNIGIVAQANQGLGY